MSIGCKVGGVNAGVIRRAAAYDRSMARGWESKSVEDQVEQQAQRHEAAAARPNEALKLAEKAFRARERQALELQRERILDERTSSPIRRAALEAALGEIEAKLAALQA